MPVRILQIVTKHFEDRQTFQKGTFRTEILVKLRVPETYFPASTNTLVSSNDVDDS